MIPRKSTVGQIIAGHLQRSPDLTSLEPRERPPVARALSKDSELRWPTCLDFVDAVQTSWMTGR